MTKRIKPIPVTMRPTIKNMMPPPPPKRLTKEEKVLKHIRKRNLTTKIATQKRLKIEKEDALERKHKYGQLYSKS